jgi:cobalt-zinc-cadmium efflux system membrane fusion protein
VKPIVDKLRVVVIAGLLAGVAACSRAPVAIENSPAAKAASKPVNDSSNEVVLSEAAQKNGGVRVEQALLSALAMSIEANGMVMANGDRTWNVGAFVPGRITEVLVNQGDRVKAGDILARLHSHEVHDTRAMYFQAREVLRQAEAKMAFAERARDRARRLLALQAISQEQTDQAETEFKSAVSAVESAKAGMTRERTHLEEVLEIPFDTNGNPEDVETIAVKSPVSGIVIERKATAGTVVNSGDPLLTVTDPWSVWVIANVNEGDLSELRAGQAVAVRVRAWADRDFKGRILRLGESLDPTTRTLQVRVLVPNPQGLLKPEMFASVRITRSDSRSALTIPKEAVQDLNGKTSVFVQTSASTFRPQPVLVGSAIGERIEITEGLKREDRVAVVGAFGLKSELLKSSGE